MTRLRDIPSLDRLYDELNERYWRGRLPKYRVRTSARVTRREGCGGLCDHPRQTIFLLPSLSGAVLRDAVLHEMAHVATPAERYDGHGGQFQRELTRLIGRGEEGLTSHLKELRSIYEVFGQWSTPEQLQMDIQGELAGMADENPRRQWRTVYRELQDIVDWPLWLRAWDRFCVHQQQPPSLIAWMRHEWKEVSKRARVRGCMNIIRTSRVRS